MGVLPYLKRGNGDFLLALLMKEMEEIVTLAQGGMGLENGEIGTDNDYEIFFFVSDGLRSRKDST